MLPIGFLNLSQSVEDIFSLAKKYGAITLIDMAQTAGIVDCNLGLSTFDFAVFAGHKTLYGPTGISGFVMNPEVDLPAVFLGGTGYESANQDMPESIPEKYEIGTLNIAGIAGLNAALSWIQEQTVCSCYRIMFKRTNIYIFCSGSDNPLNNHIQSNCRCRSKYNLLSRTMK